MREVPFAGHPDARGPRSPSRGRCKARSFASRPAAGIVPVILEREGAKLVFGWMQQPVPTSSLSPTPRSFSPRCESSASELPVEVYDNGVPHVFVVLPTSADVAAVRPDLERLLEAVLGEAGANVFAAGDGRVKTRDVLPDLGMVEDPATGSAAGPLAVHLARHGRIALGRDAHISQGEEIGRPSTLYARAEGGADGVTSVEVGGSAVAVARGEFLV